MQELKKQNSLLLQLVSTLQNQISSKSKENQLLFAEYQQVSTENTQLHNQISSLKNQIKPHIRQSSTFSGENVSTEQFGKVSKVYEQLEEAKRQIQNYRMQIYDIMNQQKRNEDLVVYLNMEIQKLQQKSWLFKKTQTEYQNTKIKYQQQRQINNSLSRDLENKNSQITLIEKKIKILKTELEEQQKRLNQNINKQKEQKRQLQNLIEANNQINEQLKTKIKDLTQQLQQSQLQIIKEKQILKRQCLSMNKIQEQLRQQLFQHKKLSQTYREQLKIKDQTLVELQKKFKQLEISLDKKAISLNIKEQECEKIQFKQSQHQSNIQLNHICEIRKQQMQNQQDGFMEIIESLQRQIRQKDDKIDQLKNNNKKQQQLTLFLTQVEDLIKSSFNYLTFQLLINGLIKTVSSEILLPLKTVLESLRNFYNQQIFCLQNEHQKNILQLNQKWAKEKIEKISKSFEISEQNKLIAQELKKSEQNCQRLALFFSNQKQDNVSQKEFNKMNLDQIKSLQTLGKLQKLQEQVNSLRKDLVSRMEQLDRMTKNEENLKQQIAQKDIQLNKQVSQFKQVENLRKQMNQHKLQCIKLSNIVSQYQKKNAFAERRCQILTQTITQLNQEQMFMENSQSSRHSSINMDDCRQTRSNNRIELLSAFTEKHTDNSNKSNKSVKTFSKQLDSPLVNQLIHQNQQFQQLAQEKSFQIRQLQDTIYQLQRSYNFQILDLRKTIAQLNGQILFLKRKLYFNNPDKIDVVSFVRQNLTEQPTKDVKNMKNNRQLIKNQSYTQIGSKLPIYGSFCSETSKVIQGKEESKIMNNGQRGSLKKSQADSIMIKSLIPAVNKLSIQQDHKNSYRSRSKYEKTTKVQIVLPKDINIDNKSIESNKFYKQFENLSKQKNNWTIQDLKNILKKE